MLCCATIYPLRRSEAPRSVPFRAKVMNRTWPALPNAAAARDRHKSTSRPVHLPVLPALEKPGRFWLTPHRTKPFFLTLSNVAAAAELTTTANNANNASNAVTLNRYRRVELSLLIPPPFNLFIGITSETASGNFAHGCDPAQWRGNWSFSVPPQIRSIAAFRNSGRALRRWRAKSVPALPASPDDGRRIRLTHQPAR